MFIDKVIDKVNHETEKNKTMVFTFVSTFSSLFIMYASFRCRSLC